MNTPVRFLIPSLLIAFLVVIMTTAHLASADFVIGFEQNEQEIIEPEENTENTMVQQNLSNCSISNK